METIVEQLVEQQVEPLTYGYECDTCELNHTAIFHTMEAATEFLETWKEQGLKTWRVN